MAEVVAKVGVKKEKGYLYFVDKQGDISAATMARGGKAKKGAKKVAKVGVKKVGGYLYFVDKKGNIARAKMAIGMARPKKSPGALFKRVWRRT